ncbi:MAG: hypothetical protein H6553_10655 [Chitinophagales bacterium]|nr:hypothetical protein [Chitinophagales bacterium]
MKNIIKYTIILILFIVKSNNLYAVNDSIVIDSLSNDEIRKEKKDKSDKEEKTKEEKATNAFKWISYLNYSDRGDGIQFKGVDFYKPFENKIIDSINIKLFKPFDCTVDSCTTLKKAQKFGNKIHFNSKIWQVKKDLLFETGEKVNPLVFADFERLLWESGRYKEIHILLESIDSNNVIVHIIVQDKLSYTLYAGYSSESLIIGTTISNFFGLPNSLNLNTSFNSNKNNIITFNGNYYYNNILGSRINFRDKFTIDKYNKFNYISLGKDFISLKTKWAFKINYQFGNITTSLNNNIRDESSLVKTKSHYYGIWLAYAIPLNRLMATRNNKMKFVMGLKINRDNYKDRPFIIDRNYSKQFVNTSNYLFGLGLANWDYYLYKNAFFVDIPEYLPKGFNMSIWIGPQIDEIFGRRNYFYSNLNYSKQYKKFGYLNSSITYSGFLKERKGEQMLVSVQESWLSNALSFGKKQQFSFRQIIKSSFNYGFFTPTDRYFGVNETSGIRGFYSPNLRGSKSYTINLESDLYLNRKVALSKGMVYAFADLAWLSPNDKTLILQSNFQYGVGVGLRFRSVDLGMPFLDFQFAFYPNGKNYGVNLFQFKLYESNFYAIPTNNMFFEDPTINSFIGN